METLLDKPEATRFSEQEELEQEFGELFERTLRLELELEAAVNQRQ